MCFSYIIWFISSHVHSPREEASSSHFSWRRFLSLSLFATTLPLALSLTLTHNHLCGGGDDVSIPPSHSILCLSRACSRSYNLMDPLPCNWSHLRLLSIIFWMDILSRVVHERDGESRWWIWDWTFWFSWGAINYSNPNRWYSHYSIYAKWRKTWPVLCIHMT